MLAHPQDVAWTGRGNLQQLVAELDRQRESRVDFVCDTRSLRLRATDGKLMLCPNSPQAREWMPTAGVTISDKALAQIGDVATPAVPGRYLRDLAAYRPEVAAQLVNQTGDAKRRFVRLLDGRCRAFLSDAYRVMDNYDLAFTALEVAKQAGARVLECSLTDSRMRIKLVNESIWRRIVERQNDAARGDHEWISGDEADPGYRDATAYAGNGEPIQGGRGGVNPIVTISNSETGEGGLNIQLGIFRRYCLNTALIETGLRKIHIGSRMDSGIFTAETREADSKALALACRDTITAAFSADSFDRLISLADTAAATPISAPSAAVDQLVKSKIISEARRDALLEHFVGKYDRTAYGLAQAVSRLSQECDDTDAADLEAAAGKIIAEPGIFAAV